MISTQLIGRDVKRIGRGLISGIISSFAGGNETKQKSS